MNTPRLLHVALAVLLTACGSEADLDPRAEPATPLESELASTAQSLESKTGLVACGTSCPAGYYPVSYDLNLGCGTVGPVNRVTCRLVGGSAFTKCGIGCPAGYHPESYASSLECHYSFPRDNNTRCELNTGASFWSCGYSCPAGYVIGQYGTSIDCDDRFPSNNRVRCDSTATGRIDVSPAVTVVAPGQSAAVSVTWLSAGASQVSVTMRVGAGTETTIGNGSSGGVSASVPAQSTATFTLYGSGRVLATATAEARVASGQISANPTTLTIPTGQSGTTRLSWSTTNVSAANVSVSVDGAPYTSFASGTSGTQTAPWLQGGHRYRFTLHVPGQLASPLASVEVVTTEVTAPTAMITASPTRLSLPPGVLATTHLTWSSPLDTNDVSVSQNGEPLRLMSRSGPTGFADPSWIMGGNTYRFVLHPYQQPSSPLAYVDVVADLAPLATISASPTVVVAPANTAASTWITWSTPQVGAQLWVSMNGAPATLMAGEASGRVEATWIVPGNQYRFIVCPAGQPTQVLASVDVIGVAQ